MCKPAGGLLKSPKHRSWLSPVERGPEDSGSDVYLALPRSVSEARLVSVLQAVFSAPACRSEDGRMLYLPLGTCQRISARNFCYSVDSPSETPAQPAPHLVASIPLLPGNWPIFLEALVTDTRQRREINRMGNVCLHGIERAVRAALRRERLRMNDRRLPHLSRPDGGPH